ncbi:MAG: glucose-6-phosphate dehydrogenase assembly protein OpcA [Opitutales bacterium]
MSTIFDKLPGQELPVSKVTRTLAAMWQAEGGLANRENSGIRASQLNLVLHFGASTPPEEALELFETAVQFGQRTPCRIIVMCPESDATEEALIRGKLYTQCFIGDSLRQSCCCEALIMNYQPGETQYLESQINQISLWLEADLPGYYWFHRVPREMIENKYLGFVSKFNRIVYNSNIEGPVLDAVAWPDRSKVKDFARSRLLKVLQSLGQFLSSYDPELLVDGLKSVKIEILHDLQGEGRNLLDWMQSCVGNCLSLAGKEAGSVDFDLSELDEEQAFVATVTWTYDNDYFFEWRLDRASRLTSIKADFGKGPVENTQIVTKMKPVEVLSEALFFTQT